MKSYHTVTAKLNSKCLSKFKRDTEEQERIIDKVHTNRYSPEVFYSQVFLPNVRKGRGSGRGNGWRILLSYIEKVDMAHR